MTQPTDEVRTRDWTMLEWARRAWGKEWTKPDPGYEFSGRKFDTPEIGGPYAPEDTP